MNKQIDVSIITPAFNCKESIKSTYESIKKQTFKNWEWIVVEDHSVDGSYDYIKQITNGDNRVLVLQTKSNSGAAIARNIGIDAANGRYIAFLDADDLWMENKLEDQINFMSSNSFEFSCTDYQIEYDDGRKTLFSSKKKTIDYKTLLKSNSIGCLTVIYDSKMIGKAKMPLDCKKREDYGAWLDITRRGVVANCLNKTLAIYRIRRSSVSSNKLKMIKYQYRVYRRHEQFGVLKSLWLLFLCSINKLIRKY